MSAATLIRQANDAGVSLRLEDGKVRASGNRDIVAAMIGQLREHKGELIQFLTDAHATTTALIEAAMRACDHHGDGEAAREQMRADCLATPLHLRPDLLDHFRAEYPALEPCKASLPQHRKQPPRGAP